MSSDVRPVWLTREQTHLDDAELADLVVAAWDVAPGSAAEVIKAALARWCHEDTHTNLSEEAYVLRALGMPS